MMKIALAKVISFQANTINFYVLKSKNLEILKIIWKKLCLPVVLKDGNIESFVSCFASFVSFFLMSMSSEDSSKTTFSSNSYEPVK